MPVNYVPFFALYAMLVLTAFACSTTSPTRAAETVEQQAYAALGEYAILQTAAAHVLDMPHVPDSVKQRIVDLDGKATPLLEQIAIATVAVERARRDFEDNRTNSGTVLAAVRTLQEHLANLTTVTLQLTEVVREVT